MLDRRAAILLLALFAPAAAAQTPLGAPPGMPTEPPAPLAGGPSRHPMADRFAAADTNHDGRLTLAEAKAAHWHKLVDNFDVIDANHDGVVTLAELRAWRNAQRAGH